MDRGDRQTCPVRGLRYWLLLLIRVWIWKCAADTGSLIIGCLYCLRSSSLCFCWSRLHLSNALPHSSTISYSIILLSFFRLPGLLYVFCILYLSI